MKKMLKTAIALILLTALVLGLAACGKDASVIGKWDAMDFFMSMAGDSVTPEQIEQYGISVIMEFTEDGKMIMTTNANGEKIQDDMVMNYSVDGDKLIIDGDSSNTWKIKDGNLIIASGDLSITLKPIK